MGFGIVVGASYEGHSATAAGSFSGLQSPAPKSGQDGAAKAQEVIAHAIEAMGGDAYLNVKGLASSGSYFRFSKGRKGFSKFWDWTMYSPVRWRFQQGEGKRQLVQIYNLEVGKGWTLEGESTVTAVPEEGIEEFRKTVKEDLDILLKTRIHEEGMNLYYYSPTDVAGTGEFEAVEFLDATNSSIVVYFSLSTHLPTNVESHFTDKAGLRHKQEVELSNWHAFNGVTIALRTDTYVDGEISSQRFVEKLEVNPAVDPSLFQEPVVDPKKSDKGKKDKKEKNPDGDD